LFTEMKKTKGFGARGRKFALICLMWLILLNGIWIHVPSQQLHAAGPDLLVDNFESGSLSGWTLSSNNGSSPGTPPVIVSEGGQSALRMGQPKTSELLGGNPDWDNYTFKVSVSLLPDTDADEVAIQLKARYAAPDNFYAFVYQSGHFTIVKNVNTTGTGTSITSSVPSPVGIDLTDGNVHQLAFELQDQQLRGYVDNQLVVSVTDSQFENGSVAIQTVTPEESDLEVLVSELRVSAAKLLSDNFASGSLSNWIASSNNGTPPVIVTDNGRNVVQLGQPRLTEIAKESPGWDDYTFEATFRMLPAVDVNKIVVHMKARYTDPDNYYDFIYQNGMFRLSKNVNNPGGGSSITANMLPPEGIVMTDGNEHKMSFEVVGNVLKGYVDDQLVVSTTDNQFQQGGVALQTFAPVGSSQTVYVSQASVAVPDLLLEDFTSGSLVGWTAQSNNGTPPVILTEGATKAVKLGQPKLSELGRGESTWRNYRVEADVRVVPSPGFEQMVLHVKGRYVNASNYYNLIYQNGTFHIAKNINSSGDGVAITGKLPLPVGIVLTDGNYHKIAFELYDDALSGYVDGQLVVSTRDSKFHQGSIAFQTSTPENSEQALYLDNVRVSELDLLRADFDAGLTGWTAESSNGTLPVVAQVYGDNAVRMGQPLLSTIRSGDEEWDDYRLEASVRVVSAVYAVQSIIQLRARSSDIGHYDFKYENGAFSITKDVYGTGSVPLTSLVQLPPGIDIADGNEHKLTFYLQGSSLKGYVDDRPVAVASDSQLQQGSIAIQTWTPANSNQQIYVDRVRVNVRSELPEDEKADLIYEQFESGTIDDWAPASNNGTLPVFATDGTLAVVQLGQPKLSSIRGGSTSWHNYTVEADVRIVPVVDSNKVIFHLRARASGLTNYYTLTYQNGKMTILKNINTAGSGKAISPTTALPTGIVMTDGNYHKLSFALYGSTLKGYVDGQLVVSAVDNQFKKGDVILQSFAPAESNQTVYVDRLRIIANKKDVEQWEAPNTKVWRNTNDIIEGWDWSLPPTVTAAVYSGIKGAPAGSISGKPIVNVNAYWNQIEAEEGVYDFEPIRQEIIAAGNNGSGVMLSVRNSVYNMLDLSGNMTPEQIEREISAPAWLVGTYGVNTVAENPVTNINTPFQIINLDIANSVVHQKYLQFIQKLKESGIPSMPEIKFAYIYSPSSTRGEEGELRIDGTTGLLGRERIQALVDAFGDHAHKLMYTGNREDTLQYVYGLGTGQRGGFIEMYLRDTQFALLGQSIDENGYLLVDESLPPIAEQRAFGDENEEYSGNFAPRFGPVSTFAHRYRESMLRALQMRRNYLWSDTSGTNPSLLNFVSLELGRNVHDTPDVWTYLRESYVNKIQGTYTPVKNFERWLYQRDGVGSATVPTQKVIQGLAHLSPPPNSNFAINVPEELKFVDYKARSTSLAQGNSKITLAVDDRFLSNGPHRVAVKVTYLDSGNGSWSLAYQTALGEQVRRVTSGNTGKLLTATFFLDEAYFQAQGMNSDIEVRAIGEDKAFSFIRVIKLPE
jgi:hypothetical protein